MPNASVIFILGYFLNIYMPIYQIKQRIKEVNRRQFNDIFVLINNEKVQMLKSVYIYLNKNQQYMKKKKIQNFILYLNQELGTGSFGKVYKGMNDDNKQNVAIKVLSKKQNEYVKDALVSQIKIMKKCHSDHVVGFVDILETANNYYIVQQYCNGGDLRAALKKFKLFSEQVALAYLQDICKGFMDLIANGIIHRDVKPQNILIHQSKLKLADFGFAKNVLSRSQLNKTMVGTPLYMAPQVLKQQKYNSKCDVWAVGLIFYQLLYGRLPWTGKSQYELVNHILNTPLTFPKEPSTISQKSKGLIIGCLKVEQDERFSWDEVYSHPVFNNKFKQFTDKSRRLREKSRQVINNLRLQIHSENIDLEKLFDNLKLSNQTALQRQEFYQLLKTLDQNIDAQEAKYVFDTFDTDQNGLIEFQEFKNCLNQSGIRLKSICPNTLRKGISQEQGIGMGNQQQSKVIEVITKLRNKIQSHRLDIYTVYHSYDRNKNDCLSFQEFSKLILKIDSGLNEHEITLCFQKFDLNNDKKISFEEFYKTICKIAGQPMKKSNFRKK